MDTLWWSWDHSQVPGCPLHVLPPLYPFTLCLEMLPLFPSFTFEKLPLPTLLEPFLKLSHTSSKVNRETFQATSTLHSPLHSDWFRIRHVTQLEAMRCKQVVCGNDDQRLSLLLSQATLESGHRCWSCCSPPVTRDEKWTVLGLKTLFQTWGSQASRQYCYYPFSYKC